MHLWPSKNLRDSFKLSYIKRLEWNHHRMQQQKQQQKQKLLDDEDQQQVQVEVEVEGDSASQNDGVSFASMCQDLILLLSCCYCCFCCGACVEEK
ncbi:hypothetical protein HN51_009699 [Arachis hypogaea]|uniref:Uncharacterized protein LOC107491557 n=1 Tax=Arachis duranensis TaxID=130453 RepID=A0A6P4DGE9_ARADU|nr:uncharacterized protein LOC107491557 [Arachis duranensis]